MDRVPPKISEDALAELMRKHKAAKAGKPAIKALPSYLSYNDGLDLAALVHALAEAAVSAGIGFHFWELFLNSGLYNSSGDHGLFSAHDRLTVSYRLEFQAPGAVAAHAHSPSIDETKVDSNTKSLEQIQVEIRHLRAANRRYFSKKVGNSHYDRLYEYFRYLCINTFIQYLINPDSYGFRSIGITHYFQCLLADHEDVERYTTRILCGHARATNDIRGELRSVYVDVFGRNLDALDDPVKSAPLKTMDPSSDRGRCYALLKSLFVHADDFAAVIIDTYHSMPVDCLKVFFNFSTNVYLPWMASATSGEHVDHRRQADLSPHTSFPAEMLKKSGNIFQPINYPSYRVYNVEAGRRPFFKEIEKPLKAKRRPPKQETDASKDVVSDDYLGPMLVWPFRFGVDSKGIDKGVFSVSGFIRMMGRYDPQTGAKLDWVNYKNKLFPSDVDALTQSVTTLIESISSMLATKRG